VTQPILSWISILESYIRRISVVEGGSRWNRGAWIFLWFASCRPCLGLMLRVCAMGHRSQVDYIEIGASFKATTYFSNLPQEWCFTGRTLASVFSNLVTEFYDRHVRLIMPLKSRFLISITGTAFSHSEHMTSKQWVPIVGKMLYIYYIKICL